MTNEEKEAFDGIRRKVNYPGRYYHLPKQDKEDLISIVIKSYYENKHKGKYIKIVNIPLYAYLLKILKHKYADYEKRKKRDKTYNLTYPPEYRSASVENETIRLLLKEDNSVYINVLFKKAKLSKKDMQLLSLVFKQGSTMGGIAEVLGYKNANVAKDRKCQIMKKLISAIKT
ncbi:MAG: hypothetical protein ACPG5B_13900 [Chitinophagales bacterium]